MANKMKFSKSTAKYISWHIPKFFDLPTEEGYILDSSPFFLFGAKEKWYLQILPNDTADAHELFIILRLVKETSSVKRRVVFKMGITYTTAEDVESVQRNETFKMEKHWYQTVLMKRSTLRSTSDAVASDGTLTVFCAVMIVGKKRQFTMKAATRITVTTLTPLPPTLSSVATVTPFSQVPLPVTTLETAPQSTTSEGTFIFILHERDSQIARCCRFKSF